MSIQVHPDDSYTRVHENGSSGKTECWYVFDCDENAKIVIGLDFFQIEQGTVHAIKGGTLLLETQQSSDFTYRLYDYGRLQDGYQEIIYQKDIDVIGCLLKNIKTTKR